MRLILVAVIKSLPLSFESSIKQKHYFSRRTSSLSGMFPCGAGVGAGALSPGEVITHNGLEGVYMEAGHLEGPARVLYQSYSCFFFF